VEPLLLTVGAGHEVACHAYGVPADADVAPEDLPSVPRIPVSENVA
jgi:hypothetical protein